jgi:hypothetical protein
MLRDSFDSISMIARGRLASSQAQVFGAPGQALLCLGRARISLVRCLVSQGTVLVAGLSDTLRHFLESQPLEVFAW